MVFPKQYFNEILIEIGHLDSCQIIDRTEKEPGKEKGRDYFSEFKSLYERVSKIIKKLKIHDTLDIKITNINLEQLEIILEEYLRRIDIIEKEIYDIEEIETTIERDLSEIIEKEEEYEQLTSIKNDKRRISSLLREKTEFEQDLKDLAKKYYNEILTYHRNLSFLVPYLDATQNITHTKLFSIISCWVISKKVTELESKIQKITSTKCIILREKPSRKKKIEKQEFPPTVFKHSRILEPFVRLVKLYGIPNYYEVDPTKLISITFPLIFGLMFGDIGQGFVLMVGSAIIALKTKRTIPKILFYCGLGSILAGFIYGEFFGFYISEIWHGFEPLLPFPHRGYYLDIFSEGLGHYEGVIDNITFMLKIAILIGYIQISSGFIIQFANYYKKEEKYAAWLISVPSFLILTGVIVILFFFGFDIGNYFAPSRYLLNLPPILLIIIPLIYLFIGTPLNSFLRKKKNTMTEIGESALRTWEVGLSILTNLPSYARIFALIMIHYGLNEAFQAIGSTFDNIIIYGIILGIGNAFTILLEVIIVAAHALRLHFYEWFSKFYEGNGIEFRPFRLPKNSPINTGVLKK
ncbi:MAG: V-type ATPase 116kDa subunit family protein [Promethearchaeota archaeon]